MDPTTRFTARADAYVRTRPSYPPELLDRLRARYDLSATTAIADLGSGTGILTHLLLDAGATVFAVEPNADMRAEAERALAGHPRFTSVAARAESTTLPDASVDLVTAAQAFHWFDLDPLKREISRILRPAGRVALVWNDRDVTGTPFLREYEAILTKHCPGYRELQGKADTPAKFDALFGEGGWTRHTARNEQQLDRAGLVARVMSSSYAPLPDTPERAALVAALESAFDRHAQTGVVTIDYVTVLIGGRPLRG
jgi:SAM-dependent methyltransferase